MCGGGNKEFTTPRIQLQLFIEMQVIGTGLSRTGTVSLQKALEILGEKVYHGLDLYNRKDFADLVFWDEILHDEITLSKIKEIKEMFESRGITATVDCPMSLLFAELFQMYPDAKFIHSHREAHSWYRSMDVLKYAHDTLLEYVSSYPWLKEATFFKHGISVQDQITDRIFQNRWSDEEYVCKCFKAHTESVIATIPSKQLLLYDIKDGWEPLCEFLGCDVPSVPFPQENNSGSFKQMIDTERIVEYRRALYNWYKQVLFKSTPIIVTMSVGILFSTIFYTYSDVWYVSEVTQEVAKQ